MRISDWSSDVCSSDLPAASVQPGGEGRDFPLQRFDIGGETLDPVGRASVAAAIPAYVVTIGKVDVEGEGAVPFHPFHPGHRIQPGRQQIGRSSSRERVWQYV